MSGARAPLDELLDYHAISEVMYRYATGIDTLDYDLLDDVFGTDGIVDFGTFEGPTGPWSEVKSWARDSLAPVPLRKHYITNLVVEVADDGASASSVAYWRAPVGLVDPATGTPAFFESGGRYVDELERARRLDPRHAAVRLIVSGEPRSRGPTRSRARRGTRTRSTAPASRARRPRRAGA
jgi:hypothetical protein